MLHFRGKVVHNPTLEQLNLPKELEQLQLLGLNNPSPRAKKQRRQAASLGEEPAEDVVATENDDVADTDDTGIQNDVASQEEPKNQQEPKSQEEPKR